MRLIRSGRAESELPEQQPAKSKKGVSVIPVFLDHFFFVGSFLAHFGNLSACLARPPHATSRDTRRRVQSCV